jgi:hypothetical protein
MPQRGTLHEPSKKLGVEVTVRSSGGLHMTRHARAIGIRCTDGVDFSGPKGLLFLLPTIWCPITPPMAAPVMVLRSRCVRLLQAVRPKANAVHNTKRGSMVKRFCMRALFSVVRTSVWPEEPHLHSQFEATPGFNCKQLPFTRRRPHHAQSAHPPTQ